MPKFFSIATVFFALSAGLHAQLATSIALNKSNFIAGEPVIATVTITNHSGREVTLASSRQLPWLTFVVTNSRGNPVPSGNTNTFGAIKIKIGESLAKQVDLTQYFLLYKQGNFAVSAVIRDPQQNISGASTNRILFNLYSGRTYWSQKVGVELKTGEKGTREMKVLTFSDGQKNQLYAQVVDGRTGVPMRTMLLGNSLMLRKPMVILDKDRHMHVMFLSTPTMWVHCQVSSDAALIDHNIHQRASKGDPILMYYGDGTVNVVNSIPYNAEAVERERSKIRKLSERPEISFQ